LGAVSKESSITFIGTETEWLQQFDQIKLALPKPTKNKTNKNKKPTKKVGKQSNPQHITLQQQNQQQQQQLQQQLLF
jgi:exonuclease VII large subunit